MGTRINSTHIMGARGYSRDRPGTGVLWRRRHGRGAARAALPCAGAYASGAAGSNICPAGSVRIVTRGACRTAAAAAGKTAGSAGFAFVVTYSGTPRGCYYVTGFNNAYFNTHAVGGGRSDAQPLCAPGAPTV
jgi:hypothetical protein